jgi:hypothetical protein
MHFGVKTHCESCGNKVLGVFETLQKVDGRYLCDSCIARLYPNHAKNRPIAVTYNGMGTTFYGQRDFREDGTHITTQWLAFLWIPIIPLRSLRVRYQGAGKDIGAGWSDSYVIYEKSVPHWKQVFYTYGFLAFIVAWVYFVVSEALASPHAHDTATWVTVFFLCIIPAPTPWILRKYAQRKLRA